MLLILIIAASCNPTKYIAEDESLLDKSEIRIDNKDLKKSDLRAYIKQSPNKRIFGSRFHLGLYNLSNIEKDGWPHGWLRRIGEEPVVFDPYAAAKSSEQIDNYLFSKGYFNASVDTNYLEKKKKASVVYDIKTGKPYKIRRLTYSIEDTLIAKIVYMDSINCAIERGSVYDVDLMQSERLRLERLIRDMGFYGFSRDNISFRVDSSAGSHQVDIEYRLGLSESFANNMMIRGPHRRYRINTVYIYPDFDPKEALDRGSEYFAGLDTTLYKDYNFIKGSAKTAVKRDVILQSLYIRPGDLFQVTNTEQSQQHLSSLQSFGRVNIRYLETNPVRYNERGEILLDCIIQISPVVKQAYRVELEGTNSAGNLGGAVNLVYQHRNLFRGAEQFDVKLKGSYEALEDEIYGSRSTQEYGFETSLSFPRFLLPFLESGNFIKKYNPRTTIKAGYNYQTMPVYTRTVANATFGYNWKSGNYITHEVNPLQFNIVNLPFIDPDFELGIDTSSYLAYSYKDVLILGGNYTYTFNNQNINKSTSYWYIKINTELSGNLLASVMNISGRGEADEPYKVFNQDFAQYFRGDLDIRYSSRLNNVSSIIYRAFAGVGIPYGNSEGMPFEKQYFSGGANSLRAWQVRSLGPGSYSQQSSSFFNSTADIKLEFNAEYRFNLFWILEGALFLDAGNIWTYYYDQDRPGSQFDIKTFYRELALGTGVGLRFDLSFIILRADLGMKLRDPGLQYPSKWIMSNRSLNWNDDFNLSFGIGYPF